MEIEQHIWGMTPEGEAVILYTMRNASGAEVQISTYGAAVVGVTVPDRDGRMDDVVLGYTRFDNYFGDPASLGKTLGRCAGRIAFGRMEIEGQEYRLEPNAGIHHQHGGTKGFGNRLWEGRVETNRVVMSLLSEEGDQGYPGELNVEAIFDFDDDNALEVTYLARTDRTTVVNLACNLGLNLAGTAATGCGHPLGTSPSFDQQIPGTKSAFESSGSRSAAGISTEETAAGGPPTDSTTANSHPAEGASTNNISAGSIARNNTPAAGILPNNTLASCISTDSTPASCISAEGSPANSTQADRILVSNIPSSGIFGHELQLRSSRIIETDELGIPVGRIADISGTARDFRSFRALGQDNGTPTTPKATTASEYATKCNTGYDITCSTGYDLTVLIDGAQPGILTEAAILRDPRSGRHVTILTSQPCLSIDMGTRLAYGSPEGKSGCRYANHAGIFLTAQHFPDAVNHSEFASALLHPGELYCQKTVFRFGVYL